MVTVFQRVQQVIEQNLIFGWMSILENVDGIRVCLEKLKCWSISMVGEFMLSKLIHNIIL